MPENFLAMRKSADSLESADSPIRNANPPSLEELNYKEKERERKIKSHEILDKQDHKKADLDLENELLFLEISNESDLNKFLIENFPNDIKAKKIADEYFSIQHTIGRPVIQSELLKTIREEVIENSKIFTADKIKNYKEELTKKGKSQIEILSLLISKFENEESVSIWVENWRNFQKLHNFAKNKPPQERKTIQSIISKADFTSENAFSSSLAEISQSAEISSETKFEISREFGGSHIDSVEGMDYQLKEIKSYKKQIEQKIKNKSSEKESLDSEIDDLENEIEKLPLDDPKRQELEDKLEQKTEILDKTKKEIDRLKKEKPKDVSFRLREGISAKLNKDGSRSIKIDLADFAIKLPSNRLPFTGTKNLRAINVAFPYSILKNLHIADLIFRPPLENNTIQSKSQRDMGHLILSSLGIDDGRILSEEKIKQLRKDLSFLSPKNGKTGQENLIEFGVFDVDSRSLDNDKLKKILIFIRKNKGVSREKFIQK